MKSKYLSNNDFNYEKVNRASLACGPMVKWAIAQVCLTFLVNVLITCSVSTRCNKQCDETKIEKKNNKNHLQDLGNMKQFEC